jgi:hypothetical protein
MKPYDKSKPLISLHIPKTGGASFGNVLKRWFGDKLYKHRIDGKLNIMPPRRNLEGGMCVHGHFNPFRKNGVRDYYPEVDQFIMVLREPFEQHISLYFFEKGQGDQKFKCGKPAPIEEPDLKTYLEERRAWSRHFMGFELTLDNYKEILEKYFVYIGITEDLQTSVNVLAKKLGFDPVTLRYVNVSNHDEEVPPGMREEWMKNHPLEYALYEYALTHYRD